MAVYPGTENERRIPFEELRQFAQSVFEHCAMPPADAFCLADSLATADLEGVHSHGVMRVPDYVHKLTRAGVNPKGRPRVVHERAAIAVVDGDGTMGQIGTHFAMTEAIKRARAHGIAFVGIRGSNHCGALSYFSRMALAENMIGIVGTNALPTMAPWGGAEKLVGMNPLSIAIPTAQETSIVFDAAFANTAHGKIRVYAQKNQAIPADWAYDENGQTTIDPNKALKGLLQPSGGHKGIALAIAVGILSTLLSGAAYGTESGNMRDGAKPNVDGHFVLVIDIAAFCEPAQFKQRADQIVAQIHQARRAPGVEALLVPGELEERIAKKSRADGIPLNEATIRDLRSVAAAFGLAIPHALKDLADNAQEKS